jgi:hypothetical protein
MYKKKEGGVFPSWMLPLPLQLFAKFLAKSVPPSSTASVNLTM